MSDSVRPQLFESDVIPLETDVVDATVRSMEKASIINQRLATAQPTLEYSSIESALATLLA